MNKLYIILINYNSIEYTLDCIKSINTSNSNYFDISIIVVDNHSEKESVIKLATSISTIQNCVLIENKENYGFSKANNIGLQYFVNNHYLKEDAYIWFLNNDTLVNSNLFEKLSQNLPRTKEVVYFNALDANKKFINNGMNYISLWTGRYSETIKKHYQPYVCGASIFMKYSKEVPVWNEDYFLYFEDVDYSFRLSKLGYSFVYLQDCYFIHKVGKSSSKVTKINSIKIASQKKFIKKNGKSYKIFYILKFIYLLLTGQFKKLIYFCK